jgi:hypothetical protein
MTEVGQARTPLLIGLVLAALLAVVAVAVAVFGGRPSSTPLADPSPATSKPSGAASSEPVDQSACLARDDRAPDPDEVRIFFTCGPQAVEHRAVFRSVAEDASPEARLAAALAALLAGPTTEERAVGYGPVVPGEWSAFTDAIELVEGVAVVDLDFGVVAQGAPNTGAQLRAMSLGIGQTALDVDGVAAAEVHVGGGCGGFVVWMGGIADCRVGGAPRDPSAAGTWWNLTSATVDTERVPVVASILAGSGRLSGFVPCIQSELHLADASEATDVIGVDSAEGPCMAPTPVVNRRYVEALHRVSTATIGDVELVLEGDGVELRFERSP